jgi:hypothetical protein
MHLSEDAVRICSACAEIKSMTDFRRRYRGRPERMNTCNVCHVARERERQTRRRRQRRGMEIQKFATAFCSTRDQKRRQLICDMAIKAAGGFNQFLKIWHDMISTMTSEQRYSPRLLRLYELVFELLREEDERNRELLKDMPDDDLEELVHGQVTEAIRQDPQLAIDAAERLGWKLTPAAVSS